jgi:hypothetical protein
MTAIDPLMSADMLEATRLTREGRLAEATALMQRLFHGKRHPGRPPGCWLGSTGTDPSSPSTRHASRVFDVDSAAGVKNADMIDIEGGLRPDRAIGLGHAFETAQQFAIATGDKVAQRRYLFWLQVQQLLANLSQVDVHGLSENLNRFVLRLDNSLGQLNVAEINAGVTNLLGAANQFLTTPDLTNSVIALRRTLNRAETLLARIDGRVDPLADNLTNTLFEAQKTLVDVRRAVQNSRVGASNTARLG